MLDGLIDDEVRKSFPGWSDQQIYEFWLIAKANVAAPKPQIFESDLSHARIIRELGWQAFKEYLLVTVGTNVLDDEDFVALTNASSFLREIENTSLYMAMYGSASEPQNKKTVSARKKSFGQLTGQLDEFEIAKGI